MANKILLLGSNGCIGNYLKRSLEYKVKSISRKQCDLTDREAVFKLFKKETPDVVINCAANVNLSLDNFSVQSYFDNLNIFYSIYNAKENFGKLINFGSGAEFDRSISIDNRKEENIVDIKPSDHYGLSKNLISNVCLNTENFYTLRLFGCLHNTSKKGLFNKIVNSKEITIEDRYFDFLNLEDLIPVLNLYIDTDPVYKDMNLVYKEKFLLSDLVSKFINFHDIKTEVIYNKVNKNYTGSSERLDSLNIKLKGIEAGLRDYIL